MESKYGNCPRCGALLHPVWFTEEEYEVQNGITYKTGRTRTAVDYLICENCFQKITVDDSFDKPWR